MGEQRRGEYNPDYQRDRQAPYAAEGNYEQYPNNQRNDQYYTAEQNPNYGYQDDGQRQPAAYAAEGYGRQEDPYGEREKGFDNDPKGVQPQPYSSPAQPDPEMAREFDRIDKQNKEKQKGQLACLKCIPALQDDSERRAFVVKVYALLTIQLLITVLFITIAVTSEGVRDFMHANLWLYIICLIVLIGLMISLWYFYKKWRQYPINYALLFTFTTCESYCTAFICTLYTPGSVLACGIITFVMCLSLSLYACFTKTDFTSILHGLRWVMLGVLIGFIIMMIIYPSEWLVLLFCAIMVVLLGLFVLYDTQLILGGKKYQLDMNDYVIGVLILYTDFVYMFYYLLRMLGTKL